MKTNLLVVFSLVLFCFSVNAQGTAAKIEAKIDLVQEQYELTGEGVLTVMMDRGIDYRHPDFIDEMGNTRILYIYDVYDDTGANDSDNPFGIGTIYDSAEINASLQNGGAPLVNDIFGHGTATTGIMSGNGSGVSDTDLFKGVAPNSKIISIIITRDYVPPFNGNSGQQGAYNPNLLSTAFDFASQKIAELGMPSVTLLNIGSIGEPTDGSVEICDLIGDYVDNGNTFVCGVGDDGGKENHAIKNLTSGQVTEFIIEKGEVGNLRFTAWYSEEDRFQLSIERPNGQVEGPFSPPTGPSDAQDDLIDQISIYHRGADVEFANSTSNIRELLIDMYGEEGTYKIILTPTVVNTDGLINGFLNPARYSDTNTFLDNDNPGGNINSYSSCLQSISPGDYVATNTWTDINNVERVRIGEGMPGEIWIGSSKGPTMDGRIGVDIVAPGEIASAAYSADSYYSSFSFNVLQNGDNYYGIQTAVSAAAPITAGVIALMLEVNPLLTPLEIKSILQETARSDNFTGNTPNETWGYGKLNALAAINKVYETVDVNDLIQTSTDIKILPNPFENEVEIKFIPFNSADVKIKIFSSLGKKVYEDRFQSDEKINLENLAPGVYILIVETSLGAVSSKIVKI